MIRVVLPQHLRTLAGVTGSDEVEVDVDTGSAPGARGAVTMRAVFNALEAQYPMLRGTIRDHTTSRRRDFVRFFACGVDVSLESDDTVLPDEIVRGVEPFMVIGAIAGG